MNVREQFMTLEDLIDRAGFWDFDGLSKAIADFSEEQDVVACTEPDECICETFRDAQLAADDENSSETVAALEVAKARFLDEIKDRIKGLEKELQDPELEHATRQGTIETLERLEAIVEDHDE